MKKNITKFCLIASLLIILDSFRIWPALMEFLFIGIIPGTDIKLSPGIMLMLVSVATGTLIGSVFVLPQIRKYYFTNTKRILLKNNN
jgi:hypothetical protein